MSTHTLERRRALAFSAATVVAGALALAIIGRAHAAPMSCGTTITKDTTLSADLANCPKEGIKIGADGITLDLDGHTVAAAKGNRAHGILNRGHAGVTVRGGTVTGFGLYGVRLADADGNRVEDMSLVRNLTGIGLVNSHHGLMQGLEIRDSGFVGVNLTGGGADTVRHSTITGSKAQAVFIQQSVSEKDGRHRVVDNTITGNGTWVSFGPLGARLLGNTVSGSERDGISAFDPSTVLGSNAARDNRGYGINAPNGARDRGGNVAGGNGAEAQCLGVACA